MQSVSDEYKAEQKQPIREQSYVWVYIGEINREAQASAEITSDLLAMSSPNKIYYEEPFEYYYGTLEDGVSKADGSCYFPPRDETYYALYQGAVSESILGSIKFVFSGRSGTAYTSLSWKGMTFNFGDYYPTEFVISNGTVSYTYTNVYDEENNPTPWLWHCDDVFNNSPYIEITPVTMVGGNQRLRILSVSFGVGLTFDNRTLMSTTRTTTISHLSSSLPSKKFDFKVSNVDKRFAKDDPNSFINYFEEQQEVEYEYGRDIVEYDDYGNELSRYTYKIPGGKTALKTWSSDDSKASFSTVGFLDYKSDKYYKGVYSADGVTAYDLAADVITDAGFDSYHIDSYLKNVVLHNPLPLDTHKNCLQLIANATRSILYEDRDGTITIETSFRPEVTSITLANATSWSDAESLLSEDDINAFGTLEDNYTKADGGSQKYIPTDTTSITSSGFVSDVVANDYGYFLSQYYIKDDEDDILVDEDGNYIMAEIDDGESLPMVDVYFEAQWTFYNIELTFADTAIPEEVEVKGYADGELATDKTFRSLSNSTETLAQVFRNVDHVEIIFHKAQPHQRVHLTHIKFGEETDYTIEYRDLSATPTASSTDKVKNIVNHWYAYALDDTVTETSATVSKKDTNKITFSQKGFDRSVEWADDEKTGALTITAEDDLSITVKAAAAGQVKAIQKQYSQIATSDVAVGDNVITFSTPSTRYIAEYTDETEGTLTIVESGAYYVKVNATVAGNVKISGQKYVVTDNEYTYSLNETGEDKTVKNSIIDSVELAGIQAQWVGEYYNYDTEYSISYRGEPAIDCDDQLYIENNYVNDNLVRVESETLSTSSGISLKCKLKAKRISYTTRKS